MTRKFLFCFPLRLGNIVFGYIVIIFSLTVMLYHLIYTVLMLLGKTQIEVKLDDSFSQGLFGTIYLFVYIVLAFLLFLFAVLFTVGVYKLNVCAITTFFVYSFIHVFLTIVLIAWASIITDWPRLAVLVVSDVLLILCLFSVKYLKDAVQTGKMYHRPDEPINLY
ncbi:unnamed protein product, partial [Brenthis ino]